MVRGSLLGHLGVSLGIVSMIAALAALLCRGYADIAPTLDGRLLDLEVEFRFGDTLSGEAPPTTEGIGNFFLHRLLVIQAPILGG